MPSKIARALAPPAIEIAQQSGWDAKKWNDYGTRLNGFCESGREKSTCRLTRKYMKPANEMAAQALAPAEQPSVSLTAVPVTDASTSVATTQILSDGSILSSLSASAAISANSRPCTAADGPDHGPNAGSTYNYHRICGYTETTLEPPRKLSATKCEATNLIMELTNPSDPYLAPPMSLADAQDLYCNHHINEETIRKARQKFTQTDGARWDLNVRYLLNNFERCVSESRKNDGGHPLTKKWCATYSGDTVSVRACAGHSRPVETTSRDFGIFLVGNNVNLCDITDGSVATQNAGPHGFSGSAP